MKKKRFLFLLRSVATLYSDRQLPTAAAGFSYYLTLTFFPLLICLYSMLGGLLRGSRELSAFFSGILPGETLAVILEFLSYVAGRYSPAMTAAALTVTATSSAAVFRMIERVIGEMRGVRRYAGFLSYVFSFVFSLLFLASVYLSVLLVVTGKWFLDFADRHIMFMNISDGWTFWRFPLLYLLLFLMLSGVYRMTAPKDRPVRLLPGATLAALALMSVSILFSAVIGASTHYSLIYGSLASIAVMMLWLYACGLILLLGAALNVAMEKADAPGASFRGDVKR